MSSAIVVQDIGFSQLVWTPNYCEKIFSFNVRRYTISMSVVMHLEY